MSHVRQQVRTYFLDHPLYQSRQTQDRPPDVWANTAKDKVKVFCKLCLSQAVGTIVRDEETQAARGAGIIPRKQDEIILSLFGPSRTEPHQWIEARTTTLETHLANCSLQPAEVRQYFSSQRRAGRQSHQSQPEAIPDPNFYPSLPMPQVSDQFMSCNPYQQIQPAPYQQIQQPEYENNMETTPRAQRTYSTSTIVSPQPIRPLHNPISTGWGQESRQQYPEQIISYPTSSSAASSFHPMLRHASTESINRDYSASPALSYISSRSLTRHGSHSRSGTPLENPQKYQRTTSGFKRSASAITSASGEWTPDSQKDFERALIRLTVSAGLAFNWVSNPEFLSFCQRYIPDASIPSRKSLANRILPDYLKEIRAQIKTKVKDCSVTVQCDGWTGANNNHLVAFMITLEDKVYTVKVFDTTTERKTAENLILMIEEVFEILKTQWKVTPIALTTDSSGECVKARKALAIRRRDLINLSVGDYFKANGTTFLQYASKANELITWLRSKTAVLGLIKSSRTARGQTPLSVIRPVPTRWTAFYLAYRRLLELRQTLEFIVVDDAQKRPEDQLVISGKDAEAKRKASAMVSIIKDTDGFWMALVRIKHHLTPLAIAANITQSAHCRLDEVLLTFASLAMEYSTHLTETIDIPVKEALLASIEKRWKNSDQDVFIASVILNPFLKLAAFKQEATLISLGSVNALLTHLYKRFFPDLGTPKGLYDDIKHYLKNEKFYSHLETVCERVQDSAAAEGRSPNPLDVYSDITIPGDKLTNLPLIKLATHILSICPNSASCERLFSTFGLILTKLRTRLQNRNVVDLAECKLHIRDENLDKEARKNIRRRLFGVGVQQVAPPSQVDLNPNSSSRAQTPAFSIDPSLENEHRGSIPESTSNPTVIPTGTTASTGNTAALQRLTTRLVQMTETLDATGDDNDDNLPQTVTHIVTKRTLTELFDFSNSYWIQFSRRSALGSLQDEMELYDLLDQDAEGDIDYDLDDCVDSVLTD